VKYEDPRFEAEGSVPDTSKEKIDLLPAVFMSPTYFISPFRVFRAFRGKREHTSVRDDLVHLMDIDANGWFFGSVHVAAGSKQRCHLNDS
jgi:hypothetical protein